MTAAAPLRSDIADAPSGGRAFWLQPPGARIRAAIWEGGARGTALIFTGRTEYIEKYGRVIGALTQRGFAVAILDWRGQGLSDRLLADPMKGHVGRFADFQNDVDAFLAAPEVAALPGPQVLICHSMGGCIGMRSLVDGRLQPAATVMSAPMLGIQMSKVARAGSRFLTFAADHFGLGRKFLPSPQPSIPYVAQSSFAENLLTNDPEHFDWMRAQLEAEPGFALGPPTLNWLSRALEETAALAKVKPPEGPMQIFLGEEEAIVAPAAIRDFAARANGCSLVETKAAKHEVFMETEATRRLVWSEIDAFLAGQGI